MIKNPYLNALIASGYISAIILVINNLSRISIIEDGLLLPVIMLSLLVLSVAIMGVLFFYQPLQLFLENQKNQALLFLFKTIVTFAGITILLFSILVYISALK